MRTGAFTPSSRMRCRRSMPCLRSMGSPMPGMTMSIRIGSKSSRSRMPRASATDCAVVISCACPCWNEARISPQHVPHISLVVDDEHAPRSARIDLSFAVAVSGITPGLMPMLLPNEHPILALTTTHDTEDGSGALHGSFVQDRRDKTNGDRGFFHCTQRKCSSNACTAARVSSLSSALHPETATATGL